MKAVTAKILDETHLEVSQPLTGSPGRSIEIFLPDGDSAPDRSRPRGEEQAVQGRRLREREEAWCRSHPEILRRFAGQWLVVEGEEIIAHGKDPAGLVEEARAQGVRIPYVFYVEAPRPGVARLGL